MPFLDIPKSKELTATGVIVVNESYARRRIEDFFYLSGEIPTITTDADISNCRCLIAGGGIYVARL